MDTKQITFSDDQRLIAYTVLANQRGSLSDMRANNRVMDKLALDDEILRRAIADARTVHILQPTAAALVDAGLGMRKIPLEPDQTERLGRLLEAWDGYSAADVDPVLRLLDQLDKKPAKLRPARNSFDLFLTLTARLRLTLFLKQIQGSLEEAQRWQEIAQPLALTDEEVARIRFKANALGTANWSAQAAQGDQRSQVSLTETEAEAMLKRIHSHEGWVAVDLVWLADVLQQLEGDVEPAPDPVNEPDPASEAISLDSR